VEFICNLKGKRKELKSLRGARGNKMRQETQPQQLCSPSSLVSLSSRDALLAVVITERGREGIVEGMHQELQIPRLENVSAE